MSDRALTIKQAAEYLGITPETLYNWRAKRIGPPSYAISSRKIIYREKELKRWMDERRHDPEGMGKAS